MGLKSNVNWKYRRAYNASTELPKEQEKIMRGEIKRLRENLIRKQKALNKSKEFSGDAQRMHELKSISLRDLKTPRQVWLQWSKLRSLEASPKSSITGQRAQRKKEIETLQERGYDFINKSNYNNFRNFMAFVNDNYSLKSIGGSELAVEYFREKKELTGDELQEGFEGWLHTNK